MGEARKDRHSSSGKQAEGEVCFYGCRVCARPSVGVHWRQLCGPDIKLVTQISDVFFGQPCLKAVLVQPCRHSNR